MNTFNFLIKNLDNKHKSQLLWFWNNKNQIIKGWLPILENEVFLATKAKGIYKPQNNDYALSVRSSLSGPYDDNLKKLENGKFSFRYFQENLNPKERDLEYTNLAMKKCMKDKVPIGVFIQKKEKPNPQYEVIGTGLVKSWDNGFFNIDGFDDSGEI